MAARQVEPRPADAPEKSASASGDFSFPPAPSPAVSKPPLYQAPQKGTPAVSPEQPGAQKAEVRPQRWSPEVRNALRVRGKHCPRMRYVPARRSSAWGSSMLSFCCEVPTTHLPAESVAAESAHPGGRQARDLRPERQLVAQNSGVGSWAAGSAAAAVERYNARQSADLLRCGSSVGEFSPSFTAAAAAAVAASDQRRLMATWLSGPAAAPPDPPERP